MQTEEMRQAQGRGERDTCRETERDSFSGDFYGQLMAFIDYQLDFCCCCCCKRDLDKRSCKYRRLSRQQE